MAKKKRKKPIAASKPGKKKPTKKKIVVPKKFWGDNYWGALVIFIASVALYAQTYSFEYVLDDKIVIQDNQYTQKGLSGIKDIFTTESFQGYFGEQKDLLPGARYRPLSIATFAVEKELIGNNTAVGHMINLLLYLLTGFLLFRIVAMMFPISKKVPWFMGVAFLSAILWIVHPVHSEVVANIKGRDEIMALLGALGTLYYALSFSFWKGHYKILLASICFFLGLMAKENTITFLAVIPVSMYFFTNAKVLDHVKILGPLLAVSALYIIIRYNVIGYLLSSGKEFNDIMNNPFVGMDFEQKYATIAYTMLEYIRLSFFPHPLTHDYYPFHIPTMNWTKIGSLSSVLIHLILGAVSVIGLIKKWKFSYFIIFYLATISIVSNIFVGVGTTMNERFIYISTIGTCMLLAYLINLAYNNPRKWMRTTSYVLAAGFLIGFTFKSFTRIPDWRNTYSLNASAVKVSKNSARANCFMGTAIFENYNIEKDRTKQQAMLDEADYYISRSVELFPKYLNANTMKAGVEAERYKFHNDIDRLLAGFKQVALRRPDTKYLHQYFDYLNGRGHSQQKLIDFYYDVGKNVLYDQQRNYSWSAKYLSYAHDIDPSNKAVNLALGNTYSALNNPTQAEKHYNLSRTQQ